MNLSINVNVKVLYGQTLLSFSGHNEVVFFFRDKIVGVCQYLGWVAWSSCRDSHWPFMKAYGTEMGQASFEVRKTVSYTCVCSKRQSKSMLIVGRTNHNSPASGFIVLCVSICHIIVVMFLFVLWKKTCDLSFVHFFSI